MRPGKNDNIPVRVYTFLHVYALIWMTVQVHSSEFLRIPADTRVSFCSRFACVAGVYLLGGVIFQRVTSGAKGIDQIPNLGFWLNLGNMTAVRISGH